MKLRQYLEESTLNRFWSLYKKNRQKIHAAESKAAKKTHHRFVNFVRGK